MSYWTNRRGDVFRSDIGGTYRCNDGNPENDDPDAPDAADMEPDCDALADMEGQ